jgi:octaprenyl-diphosphate synthase
VYAATARGQPIIPGSTAIAEFRVIQLSPAVQPAEPLLPSFAEALALAKPEMLRVDALIRRRLASDVLLVNQVAEHIVAGGGKRLRPMLVLLAARTAGYRGEDHVQAAAIIEFIHTATLLHDDVVDESDQRRGRSTANSIWGNSASILVGDFLYSRAFQLMVELDRMRIMQVMADTTNSIAEGEVLQLMHLNNPDTDEAAYLRVIERKTAVLFGAAARLGAILAGVPREQEDALAAFGLDLGFAFQIADDVLDYVADAQTLGKNLGDDLAEGKATLPVIHAMAHAAPAVRERIRSAIEAGDVDSLPVIAAAIKAAGSVDYARARAIEYATRAELALRRLPPSAQADALIAITRYAIDRDH